MNFTRFLRVWFSILFVLFGCIAASQTIREPIWSPIDEIAHYDYIDRLSSGQIPQPDQPISEYTFRITTHYFDWIGSKNYDGTLKSLGPAGYSYEAQQPPVYYLILALPNALLKALRVPPPAQITILRLISALMVMLGAASAGLVVARLRRFIPIDPLWAWAIPVILIIPNWSWQVQLNNGSLSLLMLNLSLAFLIASFEPEASGRSATLAVLFGTLAALTKYTYLLYLPELVLALFIAAVLRQRTEKRRAWAWQLTRALWPLALLLAYMIFNVLRFGIHDPFGSKHVEAIFRNQTDFLYWGARLVKLFYATSYTINYLPFALPWLWIFLAGCTLTGIVVLWGLYHRRWLQSLPGAVALVAVAAVTAFSWLLTKIAPTVDWGNFRHFSGYLLFFIFASLGFIIRPGRGEKIALAALAVLSSLPAAIFLFVAH